MVLFVMAIFVGVAAFSFQGMSDEDVLRKPASELQRMAREAVNRAGIYEQQETILFEKNGFGMRYCGGADPLAANDGKQFWLRRVQTPPDMKLLLRRWGKKEWQVAAGERWTVLPSGLCEPLAVRMEWGRSFVEMQFNPLTGGVAEKTMSVAAP